MKGGRIVIVGASLAGLRAAETVRLKGFTGSLTLIGDEPERPYDRPPLSKAVLAGRLAVDHTPLAQLCELRAEWRLGVAAVGLDRHRHQVRLGNGEDILFDRLLIATGARARAWPQAAQAALDGVFVLRSRDDAARLRTRLTAGPRHVVIVGGGFMGSEIASVCRELALPVTVVERDRVPLMSALGRAVGMVVGDLQRQHGVDLRCATTVTALEGPGRLERVVLGHGGHLEADVAVLALGAVRNTEWLAGSALSVDGRGVVCDGFCRALDEDGAPLDDIFVAGDVACWPHPLYEGALLAVEHWGNAVAQAQTAAHNMVNEAREHRVHSHLPSFWSHQFGVNIKSVGVPTLADHITVTQGSIQDRRFVTVYGRQGRTVAAVAFNASRWLEFYQRLIEQGAAFPPHLCASDQPTPLQIIPAQFPVPRGPIPVQAPR